MSTPPNTQEFWYAEETEDDLTIDYSGEYAVVDRETMHYILRYAGFMRTGEEPMNPLAPVRPVVDVIESL